MNSLNFDSGVKEYAINDDPNRIIRVNPSDFGIVARAKKAKEALDKLRIDPGEERLDEALDAMDKAVREQIDAIFGEGTSQIAFGDVNCTSLANGNPIFLNFLNAIIPEVEKAVEEEKKKSDAKIQKYTSRVR